jgi:nickel/cobalt transporter (NiCoT) family protein
MASSFRTLLNDEPDNTKAKVIAIYGVLLAFTLAAWFWALVAFHRYPVLLGTAFLAYSFGRWMLTILRLSTTSRAN